MKKITLVLVMLLTLGLVAATAQEAALSVSASGSATATIGFDIQAGTFGIVNAPTSELILNIIGEQTLTGDAMGAFWGEASLAIAAATAADGAIVIADPTVTAKITNGSLYFQIWALDSFAVGKVAAVEDAGSGWSPEGTDTSLALAPSTAGSGGVTIGMDSEMFDLMIFLATETGYDGTLVADNSSFLLGSDIAVTAGPATIALDIVKLMGVDADELAIGANVALALGDISANAGADVILAGSTTSMEFGCGASIPSGPLTATIAAAYSDTMNADAEVTLALDLGDIDPSLMLGIYDIGVATPDQMDWLAKFTLGYVMGIMTLSVTTGYDSYGEAPLSISATLADFIPKTTLVLAYTSDSLIDATSVSASDGGGIAADLGTVTAALTVSF